MDEEDELLAHLRESESIASTKPYKTHRIPRGLKVENITQLFHFPCYFCYNTN
jgi:hypothetical protein